MNKEKLNIVIEVFRKFYRIESDSLKMYKDIVFGHIFKDEETNVLKFDNNDKELDFNGQFKVAKNQFKVLIERKLEDKQPKFLKEGDKAELKLVFVDKKAKMPLVDSIKTGNLVELVSLKWGTKEEENSLILFCKMLEENRFVFTTVSSKVDADGNKLTKDRGGKMISSWQFIK